MEVRKFAKLFEDETLGQILITLGNGEKGPEIITRISDIHGIAPSVTASGYGDNDEGWAKADAAFEAITEDGALELGKGVRDSVLKLMNRASS